MKKLILTLLMCISTLAISFAQLSPLTEVEFYKAYSDVPIVQTASLANGKISNAMLDYIFKKTNPEDVKYAIINALGAKGKAAKMKVANKQTLESYVSERYDNFNWDALSLFGRGTQVSMYYYLAVADERNLENLANEVSGLCLCSRAGEIVYNLIYAQSVMEPFIIERDEYLESGERMTVLEAEEFNKKWEKPATEIASSIKYACFAQNCDEADPFNNDMREKAVNMVWEYFKEYDYKVEETIIEIVSRSSNPYQISINGEVIGNLKGGGKYQKQVDPGYYHIKAVQVSGYVFNPTINNRDVNIQSGETKTVYIGFED